MKKIEHCYITGLKTLGGGIVQDLIEYYIKVDGEDLTIRIDTALNILENNYFLKNRHIYKGLILNGDWPFKDREIRTEEHLKSILSDSRYPITIEEKIDYLLLQINNCQKYYGEKVSNEQILKGRQFEQLYLRNYQEFLYFINVLELQGLIERPISHFDGFEIFLTIEGNIAVNQILEHGELSNNCFIAMSFGESLKELRKAIKDVCLNCGYNPILVDEVKVESDQTINDAIIANIKKSKFCISDFTEQKMGVYFEAGYALGRGMEVIYLCRKDWFSKTHFDTNHFSHIIYEDPEKLKPLLTSRIEAWIN